MVTETRRRGAHRGRRADFRVDDLTSLDADDSTFDAVYCERVLRHVDDPAAAVAEIVRVVEPAGRVVLVDTDRGMHANPHEFTGTEGTSSGTSRVSAA